MQRRHFSMIREFALADLVTLGNGFCGMGAILFTCSFVGGGPLLHAWFAIGLLPLAAVFDFLDGRVARWRHASSALGAELDSLADLVSFGVAPAVLAFSLGMSGGWDGVVLAYFVACGLSRLARYNVTAREMADEDGAVPYFEGTPIPTSLALVSVLAYLLQTDRTGAALPGGVVEFGGYALHPLVLIYGLSGSAMISKTLRIPKP